MRSVTNYEPEHLRAVRDARIASAMREERRGRRKLAARGLVRGRSMGPRSALFPRGIGAGGGMKSARWAISARFANVGYRSWGNVVAHVFVDDSQAPICQPAEPGAPASLFEPRGAAQCETCGNALVRATWSCTTFGKQVLWTASLSKFQSFSRPQEKSAPVHGFAATAAEAFERVRAAVARFVPPASPVELTKSSDAEAETIARELRADARAKKVGTGAGAQVVELVYSHRKHWPVWTSPVFEWKTDRAKILRKTAKMIFVEDQLGTYTTPAGSILLKTYALDRAVLERGGTCRGWTLNPNPPDGGTGSSPGWAQVLGITFPCTLATAKRAFRSKAKTAHPDSGGSPDAFRRVKEAFDAASQHLGGAS